MFESWQNVARRCESWGDAVVFNKYKPKKKKKSIQAWDRNSYLRSVIGAVATLSIEVLMDSNFQGSSLQYNHPLKSVF